MIVVTRIEVSDEQRNLLARLSTPQAKKRLATRAEVAEFLAGCVAALTLTELAPATDLKLETPQAARVPAGGSRAHALVQRLREEDPAFCAGRSDSFVYGAAKVAYARELQGRS